MDTDHKVKLRLLKKVPIELTDSLLALSVYATVLILVQTSPENQRS